jgi:F-type H+-transporting ATPase subunit a
MYQNSFNILQAFYSLSAVEVGKHLYWNIAGFQLHGQVFIVTWIVLAALLVFTIAGTSNLKQTPQGLQNFITS